MINFKKQTSKKTYSITTAIDYPNSKPHIGHAYEKLEADIIARYKRLKENDVHFSVGTDEHGLKIQRTAKEQGKTPQKFVDEMSETFKELFDKLNISYNDFIRTTEKRHEKTVHNIYDKLLKKGDIYKGNYEGLYCVSCETYYTEKEQGICPIHKKKLEIIKEESYFFKMSKYQKQLIKHIKENKEFIIPQIRKNEILERLKEPLKDLSISRNSFDWGIKIPNDKKHVFYVWVDALTNYLTTIGYPDEKYKNYWPSIHVIGKDIVWHHTVIWGSLLLSAGLPLPKTVLVHDFVTIKGEKQSKTLGNVIDPIETIKKYGSDQTRYYLARQINFTKGGDYSEQDLITKVNNELIANYANLFYRITHYTNNKFNSTIPKGVIDKKLKTKFEKQIKIIEKLFETYEIDQALNKTISLSSEINKYFQENEPWKKNEKEAGNIIFTSINLLHKITTILQPIIPTGTEKVLNTLNVKLLKWDELNNTSIQSGHKIKKAEIIYNKLEEESEEKTAKKMVSYDEFSKLEIKTGTIKSVEPVQGADKLYKIEVDTGEKRTIVSGIREEYTQKELIGKQIIVLTNLEPRKIRGVESQGMLLAAEENGKAILLTPDTKTKNGSKIR